PPPATPSRPRPAPVGPRPTSPLSPPGGGAPTTRSTPPSAAAAGACWPPPACPTPGRRERVADGHRRYARRRGYTRTSRRRRHEPDPADAFRRLFLAP